MTEWIKRFEVEPFRPHRVMFEPHIQTVIGNSLRSESGISFRRERLETADGDFIDLDYADVQQAEWYQLGEEVPVVLVIHGLEGNARRGYMSEQYRQLAQRGLRPVGMNLRSCSGEVNRLAHSYNAGATADIKQVVEHLLAKFPSVDMGIIGFSLGGNLTLKYMGEHGADVPERVKAAAAVSPPFQMNVGIEALNRFPGTLYGHYFLRSLLSKVRQKQHLLERKVDIKKVLASKTLQAFDEHATAPLNGYEGALDYYLQCSCAQFLGHIARPTLILRSKDDPVIHYEDIPTAATFDQQPCLRVEVTKRGGHVGFVERGLTFWGERQAARFLADGLYKS